MNPSLDEYLASKLQAINQVMAKQTNMTQQEKENYIKDRLERESKKWHDR